MIFESHAHYDDEAFDEDRKELLDALPAQGIGRVINVCAEVEGWNRTLDLMERYPYIYGAVGVHPDDVGALDEEKIRRMHQICQMEKTVAVGEIGLDYYWDKENHEKQICWFERQLEVAREEKLPFIIHSRDAAKDTLDTMKRLQTLNRSNDGFYIAGEDLKLRGPGDMFGIRQSGLMEFRIGDIFTDASILSMASEAVNALYEKDPELTQPEHLALRKRLDEYMSRDLGKLNL